eukprot:TRINITY_DN164_c3_g1_i2.p1 TRINITY_DN164_c3_g1~~TRINITY_DN164_c3_g1_i2.p1  ORF type:complete len:1828 (+),score=137.10 TRINITY_DN164_c3_g1_i2:784-6267(+)
MRVELVVMNVNSIGAHPHFWSWETGCPHAEVRRVRAIQESRIPERGRAEAGREAAARGLRLLAGTSVAVGPTGPEAAGVAVAAECDLREGGRGWTDDMSVRLRASTRFQHVELVGGEGGVHVINVYAPVGDHKKEEGERERFLADVFEYAAMLGDAPTLVVGDVNVVPMESRALGAVLDSGRWKDLGEAEAAPTCLKSAAGRRIDVVFANLPAVRMVRSFRVERDGIPGIAPHLPIVVGLELARPEQQERVPSIARPREIAVRPARGQEERAQREKMAEPFAERIRGRRTVNQRWDEVVGACEAFLLSLGKVPELLQRACSGRAGGRPMRYRAVGPPTLRVSEVEVAAVGATDEATRRLHRATRRIEQVLADRRAAETGLLYVPRREASTAWRLAVEDLTVVYPEAVAGGGLRADAPGTIAELSELLSTCRTRIVVVQERARAVRRDRWRDMVKTSLAVGRRRHLLDYVQGKKRGGLTSVTVGGRWVTSPVEVGKAIRDAWAPLFERYAEGGAPEYNVFARRYGPAVARIRERQRTGRAAVLPELTVEELRITLKKMKRDAAPGIDGWRVRELAALPDVLLEEMVEAFRMIERTGRWPDALMRSEVVLIPKVLDGATPTAAEMRPLNVMSVAYRMWSATRLRHMMDWQETWIAEGQHGFRRRQGCDDVLLRMGVWMEEALVDGMPLNPACFDFAKCFDSVPVEVVFALAEELGMPETVRRPLMGVYDQLRRRYRVPGGVGEEFRASAGIVQGDALSVLLINLLLAVWSEDVQLQELTRKAPQLYADDISAAVESPVALAKLTCSLLEFCEHTGMRMAIPKCGWMTLDETTDIGPFPAVTEVWAESVNGQKVVVESGGGLVRITVAGERLRLVDRLVCLGATLRTKGAGQQGAERMREAGEGTNLQKIAQLPTTQAHRTTMVGETTIQRAIWGALVEDPSAGEVRALARRVEAAVHGPNPMNLRSVPLALSLVRKGHVVDPAVRLLYMRICAWPRLVMGGIPDVRGTLERLWRHSWQQGRRTEGPIQYMKKTLLAMRWKWRGLARFAIPTEHLRGLKEGVLLRWGLERHERDHGKMYAVWDLDAPPGCGDEDDASVTEEGWGRADDDAWKHVVRNALRTWRYKGAALKGRPRLWGIGHGIDAATRKVLLDRKRNGLTAYQEGLLRHTLVDGQYTRERLARRGRGVAGCPCGKGDETTEHLFWECELWDAARRRYARAVDAYSASRANGNGESAWPPCLRLCGILPLLKIHEPTGGNGKGDGEATLRWDCSEVGERLLWSVQRMMVEVLTCRHEREALEEDGDRRRRVLRAPWRVTGTGATRPNTLTSPPAGWRWSGNLCEEVGRWLAGIRWLGADALTTSRSVDYVGIVEMVVDFYVRSGIDVIELRGATRTRHESLPAKMMTRHQIMYDILRVVRTSDEGALPQFKKNRWAQMVGTGARQSTQTLLGRPVFGELTKSVLDEFQRAVRDAAGAVGGDDDMPAGGATGVEKLVVRTDGAAKGNGRGRGKPSGCGFAIWQGEAQDSETADGTEPLASVAERLRNDEYNNVAEGKAIRESLRWLVNRRRRTGRPMQVYAESDSQLCVDMMEGRAQPTTKLRTVIGEARRFAEEIRSEGGGYSLRQVIRRENTTADGKANEGCALQEIGETKEVGEREPQWKSTLPRTAAGGVARGAKGSWMGEFDMPEVTQRLRAAGNAGGEENEGEARGVTEGARCVDDQTCTEEGLFSPPPTGAPAGDAATLRRAQERLDCRADAGSGLVSPPAHETLDEIIDCVPDREEDEGSSASGEDSMDAFLTRMEATYVGTGEPAIRMGDSDSEGSERRQREPD